MTEIFNAIGQFIIAAISWLGDFLGTITATSDNGSGTMVATNGSLVLMIFVVALPLVGLGIGLLRRLIKTRG